VEPLEYLFSLEHFGIKLGLDNIATLVEALGRPQDRYASLLVAGTNGKGSTTAMLDAALRAAGYRVGRYTSPHLVRIEERFLIDGRPVATEQLTEVLADLQDRIGWLCKTGALAASPTFFEVSTAAALELFRRAGVELAVLEVGLGGRFDATNIVEAVAGAITTIDFDHEQYLGETLEEIAAEKAGIIKRGMLVVLGERKPAPRAVIEAVGHAQRARLVDAFDEVDLAVEMDEGHPLVRLRTRRHDYGWIRLGLRGRHQVVNALVALRLLEELGSVGFPVGAEAIGGGLSAVWWPGRLQIIEVGGRPLLLDAAHNPAGARALAAYLGECHPGGLPVVFGAMRDKRVTGMFAALSPHATWLVCTQPRLARAAPAALLAEKARAVLDCPVVVEPDPLRAVERALDQASGIACVTGSLFLVGEILDRLGCSVEVDAVRAVGR
jgi:dihydrofolate synthase/folylpolyglutamate synthase